MKPYYTINGQEVDIIHLTPIEVVYSPINDDTQSFSFASPSDVNLRFREIKIMEVGKMSKSLKRPEEDQKKTSKVPEEDQRKTSERPFSQLQKTSAKTPIQIAREHLPSKKHLLDDMRERWFLIEALQGDVYPVQYIKNFEDLVHKIKTRKYKVCPRPIQDNLNHQLQRAKPISRNSITHTILLYIQYCEEYQENKLWNKVFLWLNNIDRVLNRALKF